MLRHQTTQATNLVAMAPNLVAMASPSSNGRGHVLFEAVKHRNIPQPNYFP